MSLNYKKSGYFIINGAAEDVKCHLKLKSGWLNYNSVQKYLGAIFTDSGSVSKDVDSFLKQKTKEVNVKLASFLIKNELAPLSVKLRIVDACINSSLLYGCESWGSCPLQSVEILQRKAIKMVLDIAKSTPNEIVYIESGFHSLKPRIYKRQLNYIHKVRQDISDNPESCVSKLLQQAFDQNTQFLRHYIKLESMFTSPHDCYGHFVDEQKQQMELKIRQKFDADPDSILGTYHRVNPDLLVPDYNKEIGCFELDRKIVTRYRTGCHKLKIQAGRLTGEGRENRLCSCGVEVQTLSHVLFTCPLTANIRRAQGIQSVDLEDFFKSDLLKIATTLKTVAKQLKVV